MAKSLEDGPLRERIDLDALRKINPDLLSFRSWLAGNVRAALDKVLGTTGKR